MHESDNLIWLPTTRGENKNSTVTIKLKELYILLGECNKQLKPFKRASLPSEEEVNNCIEQIGTCIQLALSMKEIVLEILALAGKIYSLIDVLKKLEKNIIIYKGYTQGRKKTHEQIIDNIGALEELYCWLSAYNN